jgi:hypothetical protein
VPSDLRKRALLVGIDDYKHLDVLNGCVNDVVALVPLLELHADENRNFECRVCVSGRDAVDGTMILNGIDGLLAPGVDVALFYFAGHGMPSANDVLLMPQDARSANDGIHFSTLLAKINSSLVPEVIVILDCCFAGGAGSLPGLGSNATVLRQGVALLTASRADQPASETDTGRGLFSSLLCGALEGGAADVLGKVTLAGAYAYLAETFGSWQQQPTLKANVSTLRALRYCRSALSSATLAKIVRLFPTETYEFPLDASYEPTEESFDPSKGETFRVLQQGRGARIVEPVGADHLYFAAIERKACRLTPLGAYYWRVYRTRQN